MTLTSKLITAKEILSGGDRMDKVRTHPLFAKMPGKLRANRGAMFRNLSSPSASRRNATSKANQLLARLLISQFGSIGTKGGLMSELLAFRRCKIATEKASIRRSLTKSVQKPGTARIFLKCDSKKKRRIEKKASDEENVTLPVSINPFDRTSKFEELDKSSFTVVRKVSTGINGEIFRYNWSCGDMTQAVAVKKLRNSSLQVARSNDGDERSLHMRPRLLSPPLEDALTEIGVLSYLSRQADLPQYLLRMYGAFPEKHFMCLVTEFADGGELFKVAASGDILSETRIRTYTHQLLQGLEYLHRHNIGHRDVSLENALLKNGVVKLMDFGVAVCTHSPAGVPLRYFCMTGKDFYRAPELYVPKVGQVNAIAPSGSIPNVVKTVQANEDFWCDVRLPEDVVQGQACMAEVCGYVVPPADVFAVGICIFILAFQCPPWEKAQLSDDIFRFYFNCAEKGLESLLESWGKQPRSNDFMLALKAMLHPDPCQRPSAFSCLENAWLSEIA
jgi:serine/threonine protein kinase